MEKHRLVPVGKIARTHGVKGAVKVYPYGESLAIQDAGSMVFLQQPAKTKYSGLTITSIHAQGKLWVMKFEELHNMDEAELLVGEEISLPDDRLSPVSEGEYYYYQLIGLIVVTRDGREIGTIRGIIETGSNDVYVVEHEDREVLIPALEETILEVDLDHGRMTVDVPEGLLE